MTATTPVKHSLRCAADGAEHFGTLDGDTVTVWQGDLFADPQPTDRRFPLDAVRVLPPCRPGKLIGLWNNFYARAAQEGLQRPVHPPYFIKGANCYAAHGDTIRRPAGWSIPANKSRRRRDGCNHPRRA